MDSVSNKKTEPEEKTRTDDVRNTENATFSEMLLPENILQGLESAGYFRPSPIQLQAIPLGRCGLDLIVQAKSGTGKTCVFSVIALENITVTSSAPQVLVLAPTREIAVQITQVMMTIGSKIQGLKCHSFIGGLPVYEDKEKLKNCHVVVGSPGRVKQLIDDGVLKTDSIRLFVLDEADKLIEDGFQQNINYIYHKLPVSKQLLAVSATYPECLAVLLTKYMRDPTFVRLNSSDPALLGVHQFYFITKFHPVVNIAFSDKVSKLQELITYVPFNQCLVFTNYQTRAESVCEKLTAAGWPASFISGHQDQQNRLKAMSDLKECHCRILVSTDLTARGIDAECVNLVVNLDVPWDVETYLHRVGRAGRFGTLALAITLATGGDEELKLKNLQLAASLNIKELPDIKEVDLWKVEFEKVPADCEIFKIESASPSKLIQTMIATFPADVKGKTENKNNADSEVTSETEPANSQRTSLAEEDQRNEPDMIDSRNVSIQDSARSSEIKEKSIGCFKTEVSSEIAENAFNGSKLTYNEAFESSFPDTNCEVEILKAGIINKINESHNLVSGNASIKEKKESSNSQIDEISTDLKASHLDSDSVAKDEKILPNSSTDLSLGEREDSVPVSSDSSKPRRILKVKRVGKNKQKDGKDKLEKEINRNSNRDEKSEQDGDKIKSRHDTFHGSEKESAVQNANTSLRIKSTTAESSRNQPKENASENNSETNDFSGLSEKAIDSKATKSRFKNKSEYFRKDEQEKVEEDCFGYNVLVRPPGLSATLDANGYPKNPVPKNKQEYNSKPYTKFQTRNDSSGYDVGSHPQNSFQKKETHAFKPNRWNTEKSNFKKSEDSWASLFGSDEDEISSSSSAPRSKNSQPLPRFPKYKNYSTANSGKLSAGKISGDENLAAGELSMQDRELKQSSTAAAVVTYEHSKTPVDSSSSLQPNSDRISVIHTQTKSKEEAIERLKDKLKNITLENPKPWSYYEIKEAIDKFKTEKSKNSNKPKIFKEPKIRNVLGENFTTVVAKQILKALARKGKELELASLIAELRLHSAQCDKPETVKEPVIVKEPITVESCIKDLGGNEFGHREPKIVTGLVSLDNGSEMNLHNKMNRGFLDRFQEEIKPNQIQNLSSQCFPVIDSNRQNFSSTSKSVFQRDIESGNTVPDSGLQFYGGGYSESKDSLSQLDASSKFKQQPLGEKGHFNLSRKNEAVFANAGIECDRDRIRTPSGQSDAFCVVNRVAGKGSSLYDCMLQDGNGHSTYNEEIPQPEYFAAFRGSISKPYDRNEHIIKSKAQCLRENANRSRLNNSIWNNKTESAERAAEKSSQEKISDIGPNMSQVWMAYYQQYGAYLELCKTVVESSSNEENEGHYGYGAYPPVEPWWTQSYLSGVKSNANQLHYMEYMKQMNAYSSGNWC